MRASKLQYPPITTNDIYMLKGRPIAKKIIPNQAIADVSEEWIYYNLSAKAKEHYLFKDMRLVKYKMENAV